VLVKMTTSPEIAQVQRTNPSLYGDTVRIEEK
jgi:hypothetical protein